MFLNAGYSNRSRSYLIYVERYINSVESPLYSRFYLVYSQALLWLECLVLGLEPGVLLSSSRCSGLAFAPLSLDNTRTPTLCLLPWDLDLAAVGSGPLGSGKERRYLTRGRDHHTSSLAGLYRDWFA